MSKHRYGSLTHAELKAKLAEYFRRGGKILAVQAVAYPMPLRAARPTAFERTFHITESDPLPLDFDSIQV